MNLSRWSLDKLVAWVGAAAAFVLFVPMSTYLVRNAYSSAERSLLEGGKTFARSLTSQLVDPLLVGDRLRSHDILEKGALADEDISYICVENTRGEVVAHTFHEGYPSSLPALWAEGRGRMVVTATFAAAPPSDAGADRDRRASEGRGPNALHGEVVRFRTSEGPMVDISAPILEGRLGTLHVGLSRARAVQAVRRLMWPMGISLSLGLFVILIGAQTIAAKVSQPLQRLEAVASSLPAEAREWDLPRAFAEPSGPPDVPTFRGTREVASLTRGFVEMAERLRDLERERESAQKHMVRAERMAALGELAAGLAHEVRNPLDGMLECVRSLEADPRNEDHVARYLPMLRDGLQRIASVMQQVLVFTRSGHDAPSEVCSAAGIVDSVALMLNGKLGSRNVRLTRHGSGPSECVCNAQGLSQALLNLILNAIEAVEGRDRRHVLIDVKGVGHWVHLTVEDAGPGVPDELRERIFEPFFTTKPIGQGTGLGLSISRELMRAGGGELVLSTQPSPLGGARFVIHLPKAR
ncbi:MAG: sensor histidine kinase [Planctomycetota bacterium]|jgi:signal transduction histidine kinase